MSLRNFWMHIIKVLLKRANNMHNYKIEIQYDGTNYNGWQKQASKSNTIQWRFERIVSQLNGEETQVIGSGRTDAGVHAFGQVANFYLKEKLDEKYVKDYINKYLPSDIAVTDISLVPERFHSRYNAKKKTYIYRILNDLQSNVFESRYVFKYPNKLNIDKMKKAADMLTGRHDFMAFCANKRMKKSTVRTVYSIDISKTDKEIQIKFVGDGFLYNMVRIMAGTILQCGTGEFDYTKIPFVLETRDRQNAGITLPPCGLVLKSVEY